jgi:hypothetical protein
VKGLEKTRESEILENKVSLKKGIDRTLISKSDCFELL